MKLDVKDFAAGLAVSLFGLFFFVNSFTYDLGSAQSMGPGYFPMLVGALAIVMGLVIIAPALRSTGGERIQIDWRPFVAVSAAVGVFALCLTYLGFVPAVFLGVCVCSFAAKGFRPVSTIIVAASASLVFWLIFVVGLELRVPAFGRV